MAYFSDQMDQIQKRSDWDEVSKRVYLDNKTEIDVSFMNEKTNWKTGDFFMAGMDAGEIERFFLLINHLRYEMAPGEFISGWHWGITGNDERKYIYECYVPNEDLTNTLYDGMEAYIKGDIQTADAKMAATKDLYPAALANCTKVNAQIGEWVKKLDDLKARPDWVEISKKIYKEHKDEIDINVKLEF